MYNRYIPQPDGSYRRNRIPESPLNQHPAPQIHQPPQRPQEECPSPEPEPCEKEQPPCCPPPPNCRRVRKPQSPTHVISPREPPCCPRQETCPDAADNSIGGFLRQLLPKNFDTGDLLIVLLLLLMSGDCPVDKNNALLTLALYLFM